MECPIKAEGCSIISNPYKTKISNRKEAKVGEKSMNSREKGAAGERELAQILRAYGFEARRGQQFSAANGDPDIITNMPNIHIECKRVERLNIYEAMAQSINDARIGETPVVMHRKNRGQWLVSMRLGDFIKLYKGEK